MYFYCHQSECAAVKGKAITYIGDKQAVSTHPSKSEFVWCATMRRLHNISKDSSLLAVGSVRLRRFFRFRYEL